MNAIFNKDFKDFVLNIEEMFKISSLNLSLYLPPEEDVEFSTSICINFPKQPLKQAKIIRLAEKKALINEICKEEIGQEISISSIWIKARFFNFS